MYDEEIWRLSDRKRSKRLFDPPWLPPFFFPLYLFQANSFLFFPPKKIGDEFSKSRSGEGDHVFFPFLHSSNIPTSFFSPFFFFPQLSGEKAYFLKPSAD